jgi:hypothetical protein
MSENSKFQLRFAAVFIATTVVATTLTHRGMHVGPATFASLAVAGIAVLAAYVGATLLGDE